jgi:hypothetical protein
VYRLSRSGNTHDVDDEDCARRLPRLDNLTFRIEKGFRLTAAQRLGLQLNFYNVLNANTATALEPRSGAAFLATRAIMIPRLVEVGAR